MCTPRPRLLTWLIKPTPTVSFFLAAIAMFSTLHYYWCEVLATLIFYFPLGCSPVLPWAFVKSSVFVSDVHVLHTTSWKLYSPQQQKLYESFACIPDKRNYDVRLNEWKVFRTRRLVIYFSACGLFEGQMSIFKALLFVIVQNVRFFRSKIYFIARWSYREIGWS